MRPVAGPSHPPGSHGDPGSPLPPPRPDTVPPQYFLLVGGAAALGFILVSTLAFGLLVSGSNHSIASAAISALLLGAGGAVIFATVARGLR